MRNQRERYTKHYYGEKKKPPLDLTSGLAFDPIDSREWTKRVESAVIDGHNTRTFQ